MLALAYTHDGFFNIFLQNIFSFPQLFYISSTLPPLSASSHCSTVLNNNDAFELDRQSKGWDERETLESNGNIMIIILRMGFEELTDGKLNPVWHKHPEPEDSQDEH